MKTVAQVLMFLIVPLGFFLLLRTPRVIVVEEEKPEEKLFLPIKAIEILPSVPEAEAPTSAPLLSRESKEAGVDIEPQKPLAEPPSIVKGLYITGWTAGSPNRLNSVARLIKKEGLNAIVIDIKDYSGHISYRTGLKETESSVAEEEVKIARPNAVIKELHNNGIYVIGRITIFQDPVLAKAHPEWAIKQESGGRAWKDKRGLSWMDAAARPVWDYNIAIAKDAVARGFDEVQIDYVRFPSDGDLGGAVYPFWDGETPMGKVIADFFAYFKSRMGEARISADIFGLTTVADDDLGIGQRITDAYRSFDFVSPMVYPSHFSRGFDGYRNPADHPYEVIRYSMELALTRLEKLAVGSVSSSSGSDTRHPVPVARLRPWLQAFDLGAVYDAAKIKSQIKAVDDVLAVENKLASYGGWLLWDPSNRYESLKL